MSVELKPEEIKSMTVTARVLIVPDLVPVRVLGKLAQAGVHSTAVVHKHILDGTLQQLPGIGPYWERRIIKAYTAEKKLLPSGLDTVQSAERSAE